MAELSFRNGRIFDGLRLTEGGARFEGSVLTAFGADVVGETDLEGDILGPGFTDLQVNGGGGVLFNDAPRLAALEQMAKAHRRLGVVRLLPTLITDQRTVTDAAIAAAIDACTAGVPGIKGLHLEGPHLSVARKGAHAGDLIRRMDDADLRALQDAARALPVLKVTIAPETVTLAQVSALAEAGVLVSLGHTDADFETCQDYIAAGARCVTHLFNAMSQMGSRQPGLVGAALASGQVSAGLIADGVHVHAEAMRVAWASKTGPGAMFLVSDAMAVAGTDDTGFRLNGRMVSRQNGALRLDDGTLAGADLELLRAVSLLVREVGVDLDHALAAATSVPAAVAGLPDACLTPGVTPLEEMIRIKSDLSRVVALNG
jgi:N-acetylglucosamine-6-phosphate deacetylase